MLSVFDQGPPPPCPHPFNMAAHVLAKATELRDKTALSVLHPNHTEDMSYGDLLAAVGGIATGLRAQGCTAGSRILLRLGNTPDTPLTYLAAISQDMVPVPTSAQLTETETSRIIADLDPALILHDSDVPCPEHPRRVDVAALSAWRTLPPAPPVTGDPNRTAYIVYTSGTSGQPRAVEHAHRAIWARQMMIRDWYDLGPDDRLLHAGAFNWTYTMGTGLMDPWSVGATALIPAPNTPPGALPDLLSRHGATIFAAAPGVYRKAFQPGAVHNLPALRHGLSAGEKLGEATRTTFEAATSCSVHEAYGMSECSTFISACPANPATGRASGRPQQGRRIAILDPDGQPVPRGTPGIISVHSDDPGLMRGYLNAPDETALRFKGPWFLTGDEGVMEDDNQIIYLGRADDMMNAGGYRVSPLEVEAALSDAPGLDTVAVIDVQAKEDVRIIAAFYTAAAPLDTSALQAHAAARLAGYKTPRAYIHVPELPTGPNGKLTRKALRRTWSEK